MPSIAVQSASVAVSAATAKGRLTVASNAYLFPGANAWVTLDSGASSVRVKILACISTDTVLVRKWPVRPATAGEVAHTQENYGAPSYGLSDMTAYNGASHICMEAQSVPIDPAYAKRVVA